MRDTGLCFPVDAQGRVLLGRKKRGFGAGKWNGFGGKIEAGETIRQCAVRELREEAGLLAAETALQGAARLFFRFQDRPAWNHWGYVYMVYDFQGTPQETEEMAPAFFCAAGHSVFVHVEGRCSLAAENIGKTNTNRGNLLQL